MFVQFFVIWLGFNFLNELPFANFNLWSLDILLSFNPLHSSTHEILKYVFINDLLIKKNEYNENMLHAHPNWIDFDSKEIYQQTKKKCRHCNE